MSRSLPAILCACCAVLAVSVANAQDRDGRDSLRRGPHGADSSHHHADTSDAHRGAAGDTARAGPPAGLRFRDLGAPLGAVTAAESPGVAHITKRDLVWERYFTLHEPLAARLPAYALSMGYPGSVRALSFAASSPDAIGFSFNGMPLWGVRHALDHETYPVEFVERVEVLRGAAAAALGTGESLIALNAVAPRYDVGGTYARLWYSQGPNNTSNADVVYAHNLSREVNLSLGVRKLSSDGVFTAGNQDVSGWSVRGMVRWDAAENLSVSLTELFCDITRGSSGGLTDSSSDDQFAAEVLDDTLSERQFRHDLTASARWYPFLANAAPDTAYRVDAALYAAYVERDFRIGDRGAEIAGYDRTEHRGMRGGGRIGLQAPLGPWRLTLNGSAQGGSTESARADLGGLVEAPIGALTLRAGARLDVLSGSYSRAVGAGELEVRLGERFSVRASLRNTIMLGGDGLCPDVDSIGGEPSRALNTHYTGTLAEGALLWSDGSARAGVEGFLRIARPYACAEPVFGQYTVAGGALNADIPIAFLVFHQRLVGTLAPEQYRAIPVLAGHSELSGRFDLFEGNLNLKLGTLLEYQSGPALARYDDISGEFFAPRSTAQGGKAPFPLWSAYVQARIGTAYIRVEIRNILGVEFATLQRYPVFDRGFYLGVNWAFVD